MNGAPVPPQHGYPVRLVVPGWYGMASVKWLREIRVVDHEFAGFQHQAYRLRQEAGEEGVPVTRIEPRALLVPPGFPDFMSRVRVVDAGPVVLRGRAWSGWGPVERVEVSTDDGATWAEADLESDHGAYAWRGFRATWDAAPGRSSLRARATDATGRVQPTEPVVEPRRLHQQRLAADRRPRPLMSRNLVVCLDGTSNEPETGTTNVARAYAVAAQTDEQLVFYDPGVGTMGARGAVTGLGKRATRTAGPRRRLRRPGQHRGGLRVALRALPA